MKKSNAPKFLPTCEIDDELLADAAGRIILLEESLKKDQLNSVGIAAVFCSFYQYVNIDNRTRHYIEMVKSESDYDSKILDLNFSEKQIEFINTCLEDQLINAAILGFNVASVSFKPLSNIKDPDYNIKLARGIKDICRQLDNRNSVDN